MLVAMGGSSVDLTHVLFGSILAVDTTALVLITGISSLIVITLAVIFRALVVECLDPLFLRSQGTRSGLVHGVFLGLVVLNLTAGFQTLGTLMAVGLMMLPATTARFWSTRLEGLIVLSVVIALGATIGLVLGFRTSTNLAWAYGVGISFAMTITTCLAFFIMRERWKWPELRRVMLTFLSCTTHLQSTPSFF